MPSLLPDLAAVAAAVRFDSEHLFIGLADGRELRIPLAWFPRLLGATPEQRTHWRLVGGGEGIHWPDVDEDVSVALLLGLPEN